MDANKAEVMEILGGVYGKEAALSRYVSWRLFFMACAELFGFAGGEEWGVSHYLFEKK
jgi:cyclopropane-fatty-acyl-phospholipid synthase